MILTIIRKRSRLILDNGPNSFWAAVEHLYFPILLFVTSPWFVERLNGEGYGVWVLVMSVSAVGGLISSGVYATTVRQIAAKSAECNVSVRRIVETSVTIALVGSLTLVAFLVLVYSLKTAYSNTAASASSFPLFILAAGCLLLLIDQLDFALASCLKGLQLWRRSAVIETISRSLQLTLCAVLTSGTQSPQWAVLGYLAGAALRLLWRYLSVRSVLPVNSYRPTANDLIDFWREARWGLIQGIGTVSFNSIDRLIVGTLLGTTAISTYFISTHFAMLIHSVITALASVILPMTAKSVALGNGIIMARRLRTFTAIAIVMAVFFYSLLAAVSPTIISLFYQGETAAGIVGWLPELCIAYALLTAGVPAYFYLLGAGQTRAIAIIIVVAGLSGLGVLVLGIQLFSEDAAAWGRLTYAAVCICTIVYALNITNKQVLK